MASDISMTSHLIRSYRHKHRPCYSRAIEPDMALSCNPGLDNIIDVIMLVTQIGMVSAAA